MTLIQLSDHDMFSEGHENVIFVSAFNKYNQTYSSLIVRSNYFEKCLNILN